VTIGLYTEEALHSFNLTDGAYPSAPLIQARDAYYYGTGFLGGTNLHGVVFGLDSSGNFTTLHSFSGPDGAGPVAGLVQATDGYFYGTTYGGGNAGTIFKLDSAGNVAWSHPFVGGGNGQAPYAGLIQASDGYLYGTTVEGGAAPGTGVVFRTDTYGNVTTFSPGTDGLSSSAGLIEGKDGYLYGTSLNGGNNLCTIGPLPFCGMVFKIDSAGNLTPLYSFTGALDGANPAAALIQASDGFFYGTTLFGGNPTCKVSSYSGCGTIFKIDSAGNFTTMHQFSGGSEGGLPFSALIQGSDDDFYGTAFAGGDPSCTATFSPLDFPPYTGCGTVFKMDSAGNVNALHEFVGGPTDGSNPFASLVEGTDGFLYGTTLYGGTSPLCPSATNTGGCGTIFRLSGPGGPLPAQRARERKPPAAR
jgi:uncharacterized repeat protein (TIGR03803 family)